jgi:ABC-type branched-subunit amino acid transport system ATPase component
MNAVAPILSLSGVCHSFGGLRAVDQVAFEVTPGGITSLIGPNGAGKTTVFNIVSGVLAAHAGSIQFGNQPIENTPPHRVAALGIGRTFQAPRVFPGMSVLNNVMVGLRLRGEGLLSAILRTPSHGRELREARERSEELLEAFGLLHRAREMAGRLSFGEQRFLSIARTLVAKPTLILMDEPTVGLDDTGLAKLTDVMRRLVSSYGVTVLLIEHHMETVMSISQKVVLLVQGRVVIAGKPEDVRNSPAMLEAYLGKQQSA